MSQRREPDVPRVMLTYPLTSSTAFFPPIPTSRCQSTHVVLTHALSLSPSPSPLILLSLPLTHFPSLLLSHYLSHSPSPYLSLTPPLTFLSLSLSVSLPP